MLAPFSVARPAICRALSPSLDLMDCSFPCLVVGSTSCSWCETEGWSSKRMRGIGLSLLAKESGLYSSIVADVDIDVE
jgi:hypothetical protein